MYERKYRYFYVLDIIKLERLQFYSAVTEHIFVLTVYKHYVLRHSQVSLQEAVRV